MYKFINNYSEPIALTVDQTSAALALPDGKYRLTVADSPSAATRWEIIDAVVSASAATLERAKEGTGAQEWPAGSVIYNALTAETLNSILADIQSLKPVEPASDDLVLEVAYEGGLDTTIAITVWPTEGGSGARIDVSDGQVFDYPATERQRIEVTLTEQSTISIGGDLDAISFNTESPTKLLSWGKEKKGVAFSGSNIQVWPLATNIIEVPNELPSWITFLEEFFSNSPEFNQDISAWDVANVDRMDRMLAYCSSFNQDLSGWCVPLIASEPADFSTGATAWTLPKPIWGTCPS